MPWSGGSSRGFLQLDPAPCDPCRVRRVLVRAGDRGVLRQSPVDQSLRICNGGELGVYPIPGAIQRHSSMPCPYRLPCPVYLRKISPRDPRPIPVHDRLHHQPRIVESSGPACPSDAAASHRSKTTDHPRASEIATPVESLTAILQPLSEARPRCRSSPRTSVSGWHSSPTGAPRSHAACLPR